MKLSGKAVDLITLAEELRAAGIDVLALGTVGDELIAFDEKTGKRQEIAETPEALAVLAAHTPPAPPLSNDELLDEALDKAATPEDAVALVKAWIKTRASGGTALKDAIGAQTAKIQPVG